MSTIVEFGPTKETHFGEAFLWIVDSEGIKWKFHRTAIQNPDGTFYMEQINEHEALLKPGVIYRPEDYESRKTIQSQTA